MKSLLRTSDRVGRTGGEEFVLLVPDGFNEHLLPLAERLRHTVAASVATPDGMPVHVSLGVAHCLPQDERAEMVLSRADAALYTAKALGRNRLCVSDELLPLPV